MYRVIVVAIAILFSLVAIGSVSALTPSALDVRNEDQENSESNQQTYDDQGILFYKSDEAEAVVCADNPSGGSSSLSGANNLEKIWNFFLGKEGVSDIVAAAIVGNIAVESGGNPILRQGGTTATDPSTVGRGKNGNLPLWTNTPGQKSVGDAWGIAQWDPGNAVLYWQKQSGVNGDITTLDVQLEILWWHLNNIAPTSKKNILAEMKASTSIAGATSTMTKRFFGPSIPHMSNRVRAAVLAMSYPKNPSVVDISDSGLSVSNPGVCDPDESPGGSAGIEDLSGISMYYQNEAPWATQRYGIGSIKTCACGPTSMAIIASTLTGDKSITPKTMADLFYNNGGQIGSGRCGSTWLWQSKPSLFKSNFGVDVTRLGTDWSKIDAALERKSLIIISVGSRTPFTSGGHIMVIRGKTDDGRYLVADPNSRTRSEKKDGFAKSSFLLGNSEGTRDAWAISGGTKKDTRSKDAV